MNIIDTDTLQEVADAFGLGWEMRAKSKNYDQFGPAVVATTSHRGFLTRVSGHDHARRRGSKVADSDGHTVFEYPDRWTPISSEGYFKKDTKKTHTHFTQGFQVSTASFAAIEVCGVPERIFLFVNALGFDISAIIVRLLQYRYQNPPKIFPDECRKFYPSNR